MSTLLKSLFVASALTSMTAAAGVLDTTASEAKFTFEGTIAPMCKTNSGLSNSVTGLILDSSKQTQQIGTLDVWCNTGRNAATEYTSLNGGFLQANNSQKSKIAYKLSVGDATDIDLATAYKHTGTLAGTGKAGDTKATLLRITPQSTGLDDAGTYSDTITVTVSPN